MSMLEKFITQYGLNIFSKLIDFPAWVWFTMIKYAIIFKSLIKYNRISRMHVCLCVRNDANARITISKSTASVFF